MNNTEFHSIGTDILVIGSRRKVGTSSLRRMLRENNKVIKKEMQSNKEEEGIRLRKKEEVPKQDSMKQPAE